MSGVFITFEGGDGAGKTTQLRLLEEWLTEVGYRVVKTREPGGTPLGQEIRELLLHGTDPVDARAEALLYAADRAQHIATIVRPALERGDVVLQDRYIDSSLAYQGAGRVLETQDIAKISEWATLGLQPNLTVLLDIDPREAILRMQDRGVKADRIESENLAFHDSVREAFLKIASQNSRRVLVCDASQNVEEIASSVRARVEILLAEPL